MDTNDKDDGTVSIGEVVDRVWAEQTQDLVPEFTAGMKARLDKRVEEAHAQQNFTDVAGITSFVEGFVQGLRDYLEHEADKAISKSLHGK